MIDRNGIGLRTKRRDFLAAGAWFTLSLSVVSAQEGLAKSLSPYEGLMTKSAIGLFVFFVALLA